ncbi:MAG: DinB family protein [Ferruginibacter sp.]|nr:DinB family protein [Ferruginibacter sp.]
MNQQEINDRLSENHKSFVGFVTSLNEQQFEYSFDNKWTAGQQLDHIYRALRPLTQGLALPKFLLRLIFPKSNRASITYESLVQKYTAKLAAGGKATRRFIPAPVSFNEKNELCKKILKLVARLSTQIDNFTEEELDIYILPHPLLGKLTIREMMYFTIYHAAHHHEQTKRNLI